MDHFLYRNGELHAEDVPLADIARRHGTPTYVYSRATLERHIALSTRRSLPSRTRSVMR